MSISIGSAVGAGFTLIGRRFFSVIAWGFFFYLALGLLFGIGILVVGVSAFSQFGGLNSGSTPDQVGQAMLTFFMALWPALVLVAIGAVILGVMVQGAVFRAVLLPEEKGFFSLRFGGRELSLILLGFVMAFFGLLFYVVSAAICGGVIYAASRIQGFLGPLLATLFCIAYAIGFIWVCLRFALAAPMTFAEGRVRFFGSWGLTRGHGWAMFGLAAVVVLVLIGVSMGLSLVGSIINMILLGGAMAAISGGNASTQDPSALLLSHWPVLAAAYAPSLILAAASQGISQAVANAPWAEAYRQLRGSPDVAGTFT